MGDNDAVTTTTHGPARAVKADPQLMGAHDEAREALVSTVSEVEVGEHLGAVAEDERVVTHFFAAVDPGYVGWRWAVTITRASRQKTVTLNEVVLLPGDAAVRAPEWVPWKDRVGPGDLGPGDLVPVTVDDVRLVPGYLVGDADLDPASAREQREVVRELGLGRDVVLSVEGRDEAAERWYDGPHGPDDPIAQEAPGRCGSCGFLLRLAGPLTFQFGVCANASSPSDGHAVSFDHGCGAHSDVREEPSQHQPAAATPFHDTITVDTWGDAELDLL